MKVFCYGAQMSYTNNNVITQKIDEYISAKSDIFVSDYNYGDYETQKYLSEKEYKNVTIVFTRDTDEYDEWPRENVGEWPYKMLIRKQYEFNLNPLIAFAMAEECDEGFFAWDGTDIDVFVGILVFLGYGKKCYIFNANSGDIKVVNRIVEWQTYVMAERNHSDKNDVELFHGDDVDLDVLTGYKDSFGYMMELISEKIGEKLYKDDLKKLICKSKASIKKKRETIELLYEKEDIFFELIRKVTEWKSTDRNKDDLKQLIMNTYEHSFRNARGDLSIAEAWMEHADGSCDDIVMYLWERVEYNGYSKYIPVGMYADIDEALYYIETMTQCGGKIEVWERKRGFDSMAHFEYRVTFYTDDSDNELNGFQFMRKCHINDHDPFEPESYIKKNDNYMYEDTVAEE